MTGKKLGIYKFLKMGYSSSIIFWLTVRNLICLFMVMDFKVFQGVAGNVNMICGKGVGNLCWKQHGVPALFVLLEGVSCE